MAYWSPFTHDNQAIDLSHLEPFDLTVVTPSKATRLVRVTFSTHTFTRRIEASDPAEHKCFDDRVFCPDRYELSKGLAQIVTNLSTRRVYQTWEKRSYVYLATIEAGTDGGHYHVFFGLKPNKNPRRVNLTIESAYRKDPSTYTPPKKPNPIRFGLLIEKVFTGQPLQFR